MTQSPSLDPVPEVVLHEEQLRVGVERTPYRRLRVAKRVVVEQQTVTVQVRREELVVEELEVGGPTDRATPAASGAHEPLVLVLSREVPDQVLLRTEPVELVRVHVEEHSEDGRVRAQLRREKADVETTP
jgi:stress response protein YsnF